MALSHFKELSKPITALVLGFIFFTAHGQEPEIVYHSKIAVGVRCTACQSYVSIRLAGNPTAILGRVEETSDETTFYPALPFDSDLVYELWDGNRLVGTFRPEAVKYPATEILGIFPKDDILPANLLKIHVVFSASMSFGDSYRYMHFFRDSSEVSPLLTLQPELWNDDRTVLTLWLDPGRIKRDLLRQKELGTPLTEGEKYRMLIDSSWRDDHGQLLATGASKVFRTSAADRQMPSVTAWQITPPQGTSEALFVMFDESMDYLLLHEAIHVVDNHQEIDGDVSIHDDQRQWKFIPHRPWSEEVEYQLIVESRLEDLAGNNLHRPFDRDLQVSDEKAPEDLIFTFQLPKGE